MKPQTFIAPFAKVERAKAQITELETEIKNFFSATGYEIVSNVNMETEEEVWGFKLKQKVPHDIAVRVGEILHNLRSSLDQMLAEIVVRLTNKSASDVQFPFGSNFSKFEYELKKQKKLPPDAITMIRALKPYDGGDELLWLLHLTNRRDKHRMGLVPVNLRTEGRSSYLSVWYGVALVIGSIHGQHLLQPRRPTALEYLKMATGSPSGMYGLCRLDPATGLPMVPMENGHKLSFTNFGPGRAEDSLDFLTATPGTKFMTDFQPSFDIAFGDVRGIEREPVTHVLANLRDLVECVLLKFERRFFP